MSANLTIDRPSICEKYVMALDKVTERLERIGGALHGAGILFALVGGQAVAIWVATMNPAAVRTTKNVDILLRREDLARARAAALSVDMDYFEVTGVGMFMERTDPNPRHGVHLLWAGEKVRPESSVPSPMVEERQVLELGKPVISLAGLVRMKLLANRDQDRVHLRDLIEVGLVERNLLQGLPPDLMTRLEALLTEAGR